MTTARRLGRATASHAKHVFRRTIETSSSRVTVATVLILAAAAAVTLAFPWTRDMHTGPVVLPQVAPRMPVEDTISLDGPQILDRLSSRGLLNPRPDTPEVLEEGAWLYGVYCAICHGATGQGNGKIAEHYRRMPNLSLPQIQAYTDGWIYSIIREGGFNMPASAESLSVDERWALVHFLRTFQTSE